MSDSPDKERLAIIKPPLMAALKQQLTEKLKLRFRFRPGDTIVAHREIKNLDDTAIMLHCEELDDNSGYGIYIIGAGHDAKLVEDYRSKVAQALPGTKQTFRLRDFSADLDPKYLDYMIEHFKLEFTEDDQIIASRLVPDSRVVLQLVRRSKGGSRLQVSWAGKKPVHMIAAFQGELQQASDDHRRRNM